MNSIILIVDDEPTGLATIESILEGEGYQIERATNGFEALQKAETLHPDLILLDVMMPGLDGFETCRRIRKLPDLLEVPILILTALDEKPFLIEGIESGADDFLTKPIDRQELRTRVRTIIRLDRYRTLLKQKERLHAMAHHVVTAQERERLRISRNLHDDLGQALSAHLLNLNNIDNALPMDENELHVRMKSLMDSTGEIIEKIRTLAQDLRPPLLETMGLVSAIEGECNKFSHRTGLPVEVTTDRDIGEISDLQATILFRVLQEALTNISRHAQASRAWVDLTLEENQLKMTVQDNGRGLPENINPFEGLGIVGMQERLAVGGGSLNLHSIPGKGTILTASLPVETFSKEKEKS
jgi:signal transduction histidine kinase